MQKIAAAVLFGVLTAGAAHAADLGRMPTKAPPVVAPVYNWNGFYIGAHLGWGRSNTSWSDPTVAFGAIGDTNSDGFLGGGQLGYNWQFAPNWVLGIEGQISAADLNRSTTFVAPGASLTLSHDAKWIASVTGRLGYAADNWLFYAKGGGAWADVDATATATLGGLSATASANSSRSGWTAGGGIEWGFAPNWSALVEYQFYDFGSKTFALNPGAIPLTADNEIHSVKVGVNYRFGAWR
jgi:outer membrane immunogenic protein